MQFHAMNNKAADEMSRATEEGELIGALMDNISARIKEGFKQKKTIHTSNINFLNICCTGCGCAGGHVGPCTIVNVFHFGFQLS